MKVKIVFESDRAKTTIRSTSPIQHLLRRFNDLYNLSHTVTTQYYPLRDNVKEILKSKEK